MGETVREREFSAPIQAVIDLLQPDLTVRHFRAPDQAWITRDFLRVVTIGNTNEAYTVAYFGEELDPVARLDDPPSAADVVNRLLRPRTGWVA